LGNYLCNSRSRQFFAGMVRHIRNDAFTVVVPASSALVDAGVGLYELRLDKTWSMTDCISMTVMETRGLIEALTTDHHFEQAGFTILLK